MRFQWNLYEITVERLLSTNGTPYCLKPASPIAPYNPQVFRQKKCTPLNIICTPSNTLNHSMLQCQCRCADFFAFFVWE